MLAEEYNTMHEIMKWYDELKLTERIVLWSGLLLAISYKAVYMLLLELWCIAYGLLY